MKKFDLLKKVPFILVEQLINCIAIASVMIPNKLVPTGLGGAATVLHNLFGWDIQLMLIILALALIIWALVASDRSKVYYAAFCYGLFTFYFGIVDTYVPDFITDPIVAAVLSAIMIGFGSGIVIGRSVPNGPEAIVGLYLKEKRDINVATFLMIMNMVIISSSILYGDLTMIIYSVIANYITGMISNYVILGGRRYFVVNILSDHYLEITEFIHQDLKRSVTFVQSMDTSNVKKRMLLKTVVSSRELVKLRDYVKSFKDKDSFVYAVESASIVGGGFE